MRATFTYLITSKKGGRAEFDARRISIGRAPDNMLCLGEDARRVSSHHAEIMRRGDQYLLRDLGSTNGTMINGRRVVVSELAHDDLIEFGAGGPLLRFGVDLSDKEALDPATRTNQEPEHGSSGSTIRLGATTLLDIPGPKKNIP